MVRCSVCRCVVEVRYEGRWLCHKCWRKESDAKEVAFFAVKLEKKAECGGSASKEHQGKLVGVWNARATN